jgi:hypothetical protein
MIATVNSISPLTYWLIEFWGLMRTHPRFAFAGADHEADLYLRRLVKVQGLHIEAGAVIRSLMASLLFSVAPLGSVAARERPPQSSDMPAAQRLAMPGPEHQWLEPLVGDWDVEMLVYPSRAAQPIVSRELRATRRWILDGRYLREELRGSFAGAPASRDGVLGYNRLERRMEWVTVDTFEPGQMIYLGRGAETAKKFSVFGESVEAGMGLTPTGRKRALRFEFEISDDDSHVQRIFVTYPGEPEFLFVEQRFTRAGQR